MGYTQLLFLLSHALGADLDIKKIGADAAEQILRKKLRKKMEKAFPKILAESDAWDDHDTLEATVRDVLFRLWKAVVKLGPLADAMRDAGDDKVIALVRSAVGPNPEAAALVAAVLDAAVEVTF